MAQRKDAALLLSILDCPACRYGAGLEPQDHDGRTYLACGACSFWYPIIDEVVVLLPPERNPRGLRRAVGSPVALGLERREARFVDMKALVYSFYARMDEFGEGFGIADEPVLVDVGCSTGTLASWIRSDQVYVGFDLSFASLRFARQASGQLFVQADAECLPVKERSVPFFVSREVLEHLDDPLAGSRELARMGQRGVIVVPTLDFPFLYDPINWALLRSGRRTRARFGVYGYGHNELRDIAGWRRLLEDAGFSIDSERPIGTGLLLNASDVVWHSLYSWRNFDNLPRRGAPISLAQAIYPLSKAIHALDSKLWKAALSRAYEVSPRA